MSRTSRLFQLMQSLRRAAPPVTAERLVKETGVSLRTLYRDIDELRKLGAIIEGTAGFGYMLIEDASLPPLMFSDDEIEALVLGLREVQVIGDVALAGGAKNALAKIQARLPKGQSNRLTNAILTADRIAPVTQPEIDVRELRQATWKENRISIEYQDTKGLMTTRHVDPSSIVYLQSTHHLIALCHLRNAYRNFRLDRIRRMEVTRVNFRPKRVSMLRDAIETLAKNWSAPPASMLHKSE